MKVKKDSLVLKIIFYNNVGIILSTILLSFILIFSDYTTREEEFKKNSVEKMKLLEKAYKNNFNEMRDEIRKILSEVYLVEKFNSTLDKEVYKKYSEDIMEKLLKKDIENYYHSAVTITDSKGEILSEVGIKAVGDELWLKKDSFLEKIKEQEELDGSSYVENIKGKNYLRIYFPHYLKTGKRYIIVTVPINYKMLQVLKENIQLDENDKIFTLSTDGYYSGDFSYKQQSNIDDIKGIETKIKRNETVKFLDTQIGDKHYSTGLYILRNFNNEYKGSIGVAFSKEKLILLRERHIFIVILIITLYIIIGTSLTNSFFTRLLKPLQELTKGTEEIIKGNYSYIFKGGGTGEVKQIGTSLKKMLGEIKSNREKLLCQNNKLNENILRIEAIERILMGLHIETDMVTALNDILKALTSDMGLGYSRAMYFRYSRELDCLIGEKTIVNNSIKNRSLQDSKVGFTFQIDELDRLVKSIKIPYDVNNLIGKSLKEKRIIYFNEKGYKYELGNTLFKGLGIDKFMILPIHAKNRKYGVVVVDYFGKDNQISLDEYELLKLLIINLTIRISNKITEEERVDNERENTIRKLTERFLGEREKYIHSVYSVIDGYRKNEKNLEHKIKIVEELLKKLRRENRVLKEYSELGITKPEYIDLESIFNEIKKEIYEDSKKLGITISIFVNYSGKVYGNRQDLKKAFYEIMKNSYYALLKIENLDRKMNVIISKDKNIDKVKINIMDNGIGIRPEQLEKIYEPFLTVDGNPPGLGLSLVYRVIKEHQGVIKFFSKYKEGTDVKITLNAYKEEKY
ncbi:MAG: ATP-binding protein [Fusobacteriaceae bacterium]